MRTVCTNCDGQCYTDMGRTACGLCHGVGYTTPELINALASAPKELAARNRLLTAVSGHKVDVRYAAKALVSKLALVHADSVYQSVWTVAALHGNHYEGPSYAEELKALQAALSFATSPATTSPVADDAVAIVEEKAELYGKWLEEDRSPRPQRGLYNRGRLDAANEILAALRGAK